MPEEVKYLLSRATRLMDHLHTRKRALGGDLRDLAHRPADLARTMDTGREAIAVATQTLTQAEGVLHQAHDTYGHLEAVGPGLAQTLASCRTALDHAHTADSHLGALGERLGAGGEPLRAAVRQRTLPTGDLALPVVPDTDTLLDAALRGDPESTAAITTTLSHATALAGLRPDLEVAANAGRLSRAACERAQQGVGDLLTGLRTPPGLTGEGELTPQALLETLPLDPTLDTLLTQADDLLAAGQQALAEAAPVLEGARQVMDLARDPAQMTAAVTELAGDFQEQLPEVLGLTQQALLQASGAPALQQDILGALNAYRDLNEAPAGQVTSAMEDLKSALSEASQQPPDPVSTPATPSPPAKPAAPVLYLDIKTPLTSTFTVVSLKGAEHISRYFAFDVTLQSEDEKVDFDKILGKTVTISISMEGGGKRYIHGYVGRWRQGESGLKATTYYAAVYPWLWHLTHTSDIRIFQQKSVVEIFETVCQEHKYKDFRQKLKKTYAKRDYCVQYRESAYDFLSRLLEDEGIYYYFEHTETKHTLVLTDDNSSFAMLSNISTVEMLESPGDSPTDKSIRTVAVEEAVVPGSYALCDFDFEKPAKHVLVKAEGDKPGERFFDYPGGFDLAKEGEAKANQRIDEQEAWRRIATGEGYCRDFTAGYCFTLKGHARATFNDTYVLRTVEIDATQEVYQNTFIAAPKTLSFRPQRTTPRPRISGTQTALVVGKKGEEIWTDQYGRVKVQFHWDEDGKHDEKSSCWIRVAQVWAGKQWGTLFLPRVGQEVLVSFLNGDPDQPIVTGSVYNGDQKPPYTLPDEQTKSTIKTNTSKGGQGSNEIRFEDKKGQEEFYVHAQKDLMMVAENDAVAHVKKHHQVFIQDATPKVDASAAAVFHVAGDRKVTVAGTNTSETHTNEGTYTHEVGKDFKLTVQGNTLTIESKKNLLLKGQAVTIESTSGDVVIKSGKNLSQQAKMNATLKGGMNVTVEAAQNLGTKAGMQLTQEGGLKVASTGQLVQLQGAVVKIN